MATKYETDFYGWTQEQAAKLRALRERSNLDIDMENIAEELEDMGRSSRSQLVNRLAELDEHLMKLANSLLADPRRQWRNSVDGQRYSIKKLLRKNPSLKPHLEDSLVEAHEDALRVFTVDKLIHLNMNEPPDLCPFTLDQMLDDEWWPEAKAHPYAKD